MSPPMERIQTLETIEKDIITCLHNAGQVFNELSKDKPNSKQAETGTHQFIKTLGVVESKLSEQINYLTQVSTGQPHEGSGCEGQKVLQMAWHRLQRVRSRIDELDRLRHKSIVARNANAFGRPQQIANQQPPQQQQQPQQQQMPSVDVTAQQPLPNVSSS